MQNFTRSLICKSQRQRRRRLSILESPVVGLLTAHSPLLGSYASITSVLSKKKVPVKERLDTIPVYVVTNNKNECVVVSPDDSGTTTERSLCLLFMDQGAASDYLGRVAGSDAKSSKESKVQTMTMSTVYDLMQQDDIGVDFKFMPDKRNLKAALQLYAEAGQDVAAFSGIPVFQAEGLYVNAGSEKSTPIFLCKDDLDAALSTAHTTRQQLQIRKYQEKADEHKAAYEKALEQMKGAQGEEEKRQARTRAEKAHDDEEKWLQKARNVGEAVLPKVEVGCLEDVMVSMQRDNSGSWSSVVFVPPGAVLASN